MMMNQYNQVIEMQKCTGCDYYDFHNIQECILLKKMFRYNSKLYQHPLTIFKKMCKNKGEYEKQTIQNYLSEQL